MIAYQRIRGVVQCEHTTLCFLLLYYIVLYYTILYSIILYYTILYYTIQNCSILYDIILYECRVSLELTGLGGSRRA